MILNLFGYSGNFGKANIYKCDFFGHSLSLPRLCFLDNFSVDVDQENVGEVKLFGSFNQTPNFVLGNRKITINTSFLFSLDPAGTLNPAVDLIMNLSAWSYQGTTTSYKIAGAITSSNSYPTYFSYVFTYTTFNLINFITSGYSVDNFQWYAVSQNSSIKLSNVTIDTIYNTISFDTISEITETIWIEAIYYNNFPLQLEPMFRMDTSEGSFYPCVVDKIDFSVSEEFIKLNCVFFAINYDRSTRFDFINTQSVKNAIPPLKDIHKSRIKIIDYKNSIVNNFLLNDIKNLDYMQSFLTERFTPTPFKDLSISINNGLKPVYANHYSNLRRTYVAGYISDQRKITGNLTAYALRSSQPTFDRFPTLAGVTNVSMSVYFGNQIFTIPYTVWKPAKIEVKQNELVTVNSSWEAITNERQGQPLFQM
jgi:hypothetical protein